MTKTTEHPAPERPAGVPPARRTLAELVVRRPVAVIMMTLLVVVFGAVSAGRLPLALMPDISYPTITVRTAYPGAAPEEVETVVSRPLEQALGVVSHLARISSTSRAEASDVILEFAWGADMREATQDIREQLERVVPGFPDEVERPLILRYDPALDPIMRIALHGEADLFALRRIAEEEVQRSLESLDGVAAVKVRGGLEREILVEPSEEKLALLGLDIGTIASRLRQENVNLSGGQLREGLSEYLVRTLNEFRDLDEIRNLVVGQRNGVPIRLGDVAAVRSTNREREVITRIGGMESVEIDIYKEGDANIVRVADQVRGRLFGTAVQQAYVHDREKRLASDTTGAVAKERPDPGKTEFVAYHLPSRVTLDVLSDQSTFIKASLSEVSSTAVIGGILAVIVLFLFLRNLTHTLIIAVSIPVSVIATFAAMYLGKVSLNIMSLGGLALGIGMLVDNSIVVLESIFRCREEGDDIVTAAIRGTSEVNGAVTASTLTTVAVFLPIVFVEGIAGQVFGDLSLAVVFSLLASLAVALWFIPMLASRRVDPATGGALVDRLRGAHIARLHTVDRASELAKRISAERGRARLRTAGLLVLALPLVLLDALWRIAAIVAAAILVVLAAIAQPFRVLAGRFGEPVARRIARADLDRLAGRIWPSLFVFRAPDALRGSMADAWRWVRRGRWWRRVSFALPALVRAIAIVVRFVAHLLFELAGKIATLLLFAVAVVLSAAIALLGFVLAPIFAVLSVVFEAGWTRVAAWYPRAIRRALSHGGGRDNRIAVLGVSTVLFVVAAFVLLPRIGQELIPQVHQGEFFVDVELPVGTPIEATDRVVGRVERMAGSVPGVARVAATTGAERMSIESGDRGENTGRVTVVLAPSSDFAGAETRTMEALREKLAAIADIEARMSLPVLFSFKTPVEVEIRGFNLERLREYGDEARDRLAAMPGFADVESNIRPGNPEVRISYDRQRLSELRLTPLDVASLIRTKVGGTVATRFREEDIVAGEERRIDVRVQLDRADKAFVEDLRRMIVNPGQTVPLPLSAVATIDVAEGPSEILRIGQQRAAVVSANVEGIDLATATGHIHAALRAMDWPAEMSYTVGGQNAEMETSMNSLIFALALAVFLVYVVMASQFESFLHPFVIMFTMPLAAIGVIAALWAFRVPLSVVVFLGIIVLAGIVVNNAIVLVDYVNHLRRNGMAKNDALVAAGRVRLRPIMMTTLTTVLGLLPMALGLGEGAEIRTPMAITVIAGLVSSTALTLIVIPVLYSLLDRSE